MAVGIEALDGKGMQYLVELGRRGELRRMELDEWPQHYAAWWNPVRGQLEFHEAPLGPREYLAYDLGGLARIVVDVGSDKTRVFVGERRIVAMLEPKDSRERVSMSNDFSAAWQAMCGLVEFQQQAFVVKVLRTSLDGCELTGLLPRVRTLRLEKSSETNSSVHQGVETLSAAARREASSGGQPFPEVAEFLLPVFVSDVPDPALYQRVKVSVEVDLDKGRIALLPIADSHLMAKAAALESQAARLRAGTQESGCKVWIGQVE